MSKINSLLNLPQYLLSLSIIPAQTISKSSLEEPREKLKNRAFNGKEITLETKDGVKINAMVMRHGFLDMLFSKI